MQDDDFKSIISQHRPSLAKYEELYKHLHLNPELSYQEEKTSELVAKSISQLGPGAFKVKKQIGGFGLVATLENGPGPVIMLRADMDALPILEKTGLPYASHATGFDREGDSFPVMHACGHDMHVASLLGSAETLLNSRSFWAGTLIFVFQPAEEKGTGAQSMIDDGLYDATRHAIPIPDVVLSAHVTSHCSGFIGSKVGLMAGAAQNYRINLQGRGGHASLPHTSVDPVVMAAYATTRLQTLVSRESNPQDMTALTVACIEAGKIENVIPQEATMKIDLRSSTDAAMNRLEQGMKRIITAETQASAAEAPPSFEMTRKFPVTWNAEAESKKLFATMASYFGDSFSDQIEPLGMSEDFSILGTSVEKPTVMWIFGGTEPEFYDSMLQQGKIREIPSNHSAYFAPAIHPTLQRGIDGYTLCALSFLSQEK